MFGTGRGTLPKDRDCFEDSPGGPRRVGYLLEGEGWVERSSQRSGMGRGTLPEVRDG